jgi:Txe/YoeB family toxin of toxin-antitoxin system
MIIFSLSYAESGDGRVRTRSLHPNAVSAGVRNGYEREGKPEPLKHDLSCYWSVKIDEANRLIFKISEDILKIAACRGHYEDD